MEASSQTYTAPDGTTFTDLRSYRRHIFNTYFKFSSKADTSLQKLPGEIDGNEFELSCLQGCQVELLDRIERVVADEIEHSRIFVGPCAQTASFRNMTTSEVTIACRELRLSNCSNIVVNVFAVHGVHLDNCHNVKIARFNGAYSGLTEHFKQAGFVPNDKMPEVVDFSAKDKSLPERHYEVITSISEPWRVTLPKQLGPPENPVFPEPNIQPQMPPEPPKPLPDMNPTAEITNRQVEAAGEEETKGSEKQSTAILDNWNAEYALRIARTDSEHQEKRQQLRNKANGDLQEHHNKRTNLKQTRFANNRDDEKQVLKEIEETMSIAQTNPWQRVISLIDKSADTEATELATDRTRMRKLLVELKDSCSPESFHGQK